MVRLMTLYWKVAKPAGDHGAAAGPDARPLGYALACWPRLPEGGLSPGSGWILNEEGSGRPCPAAGAP